MPIGHSFGDMHHGHGYRFMTLIRYSSMILDTRLVLQQDDIEQLWRIIMSIEHYKYGQSLFDTHLDLFPRRRGI